MLSMLSINLFLLVDSSETTTTDDLRRRRTRVSTAIPLLEKLATATNGSSSLQIEQTSPRVGTNGNSVDSGRKAMPRKRASQREVKDKSSKRSKGGGADEFLTFNTADTHIFRAFGVDAPKTRAQVIDLVSNILEELKDSLQVTFAYVSLPS
jgi:hypothetical protein